MGMRTMASISPQQPELADAVLACFRQACAAGRRDVAEHLLVAIEELSKDRVGANDPEHHLAEAYGVLLEVMPRQAADGSKHNRRR